MTAQLASLQDAKRLRSTLGAAFWDDPVWHYTIGSGRNFERRVGVLMGIAAKTSLRQNTVWTAGDGDAFAVWSPPPMPPKDNVKDQLLSLPQAAWAAGRHAGRGIKVLEAMRRQHPHDRPHWYLAILGTHPSAQGKGLGSAALTPVLRRCDEHLEAAYLESSKEANIPFYERHGFQVVRRIELPSKCPPVWAMWREPDPDRLMDHSSAAKRP